MRNVEDIYPLSPMQQALLFHSVFDSDSQPYLMQFHCELEGDIDVDAFKRAWQSVIDRHQALRTAVVWKGVDEPLQVVRQAATPHWAFQDWRLQGESEKERRFEKLLVEQREAGLRLEKAPLMRFVLVRMSDHSYRFVWLYHHLILDGWSLGLVLQEVFAAYDAYSNGRQLARRRVTQYRDFIAWLGRQDQTGAEEFWRRELKGFRSSTMLLNALSPFSGGARRNRISEQSVRLDSHMVIKLQEFARRRRLTLNTLMQGAWAFLLSRYTGEQDVAFGVTVSGRPPDLKGVEEVIGLFVNTVPLRVRLAGDETISELLGRIQKRQFELSRYDFVSLAEIQRWSEIPSPQPLFNTILVFENYPLDNSLRAGGGQLRIGGIGDWVRTHYPLTVIVEPLDGLKIRLIYDENHFDAGFITNLLERLQIVLRKTVAEPEGRVSDISIIPEAELRLLLEEWNQDGWEGVAERVTDILAEAAANYPDRVAVRSRDEQLSYLALDHSSSQLAHYLRSLGVRAESRVAVCLPRSPRLICALWAAFKAGAAYVPLDPAYPAERLAFILSDSDADVVITDRRSAPSLTGGRSRVLLIDEEWPRIERMPVSGPRSALCPLNLAYVIYTSGSTGRPKGVAISHLAAARFVEWARAVFGAERMRETLFSTSICFDLSVFEIFVTLASGGAVVVAENALELPTLPQRHHLTLINTAPSVMRELLQFGGALRNVRTINLAGEALDRGLAEAIFEKCPWVELLNLYGPTEDTTYSTWWRVRSGEAMRIGRSKAGSQAYVLDGAQALSPVGVRGELYLGGEGLARGYYGRADLTAERFVPNRNGKGIGERVYRTGDLAVRGEDGELIYLGRVDNQMKLRGYRIEPGEIEQALMEEEEVEAAVARAVEQGAGNLVLTAYVVRRGELTEEELRARMRRRLPEYMTPSRYVFLERLPLLPNGKIDRNNLPQPDPATSAPELANRQPLNEIQNLLKTLWEQVLGVSGIDVRENFFEIGGHSLIATRIVSRIREQFKLELPLRALFEHPTIEEFSAYINEQIRIDRDKPQPKVPRLVGQREAPLSYSQRRLWFLEQMESGTGRYNLGTGIRLKGDLRLSALEQSFREVMRRHEILRTRFEETGGIPIQIIDEACGFSIGIRDLSKLPDSRHHESIDLLIKEELNRGFDLTAPPLIRATLVKETDDENVLLLTMHHIITDGWSVMVMIDEVVSVYERILNGEQIKLDELELQYGDYARWQKARVEGKELQSQLDYWKEKLANLPDQSDLPSDWPRAARAGFRGARRTIRLSRELSAQIREISRERHATVNMFLLTGLNLLLSRLTGETDLVVGVPIAGRNRKEIEKLIGFFVNFLALRTNLHGDQTFEESLRQVKETLLEAYSCQDLPFEMILEELQPVRDPSRTPLFQVFFNMLNFGQWSLKIPGLEASILTTPEPASNFDLTFYVNDYEEEIAISLVYNARLFSEERMTEMLEQYRRLLSQAAESPQRSVNDYSLVTDTARPILPDPAEELDDTWFGAVHTLFSRQAECRPQQPAVIDRDGIWSYAELDERSNQLANYLLTTGIRCGDVVAIYAHRSGSLPWAVIGVLKAGAAFLLLDPSYPVSRLINYLELAGPRGWLQLEAAGEIPVKLRDYLASGALCASLSIPSRFDAAAREFLAGCSSERPGVTVGPDDIACISFTSGSTGRPKGIIGRHGPLSHFLPWQKERFDLRDSDRYSMLSGLSHDPLQRDIFTPLSLGGTICVPEPDKIGRPGWLSRWMSEAEITIANLTPAMMQLLTKSADDAGEEGSAKKIESLRYAFVVGDALTHYEVRRFLQVAPSATCVNFYGATETQRAVGYYVIPKAIAGSGRQEASLRSKEIIPLGKGIKDAQLLVLRSPGQLAGVGERGEIYVRSPHLAQGYLGNDELTSERFLPNPFSGKSGDRMYKTGDLGCYLPDGNVEFLGRNDQQIKIRGFRIEPAEIEAALGAHPSVKDATVIARTFPDGEKRLVAYLVFRPGVETSASDFRSYLGERLPIYMIPSFFVAIDRLPLTPNGKVDRQALLESEFSEQVEKDRYVEPRNEIEKSMVDIWKEVLGVEHVGVHSNFFELGGHSLLATQIISRVRALFKIDAPLEKFFLDPTIAGLAEFVSQRRLWNEESQIEDALKSIERMTDEEVIEAINRQARLNGIRN